MEILEHIGHTPLVRLHRVVEREDIQIYAKCEFLNPGGSIKDRIALGMIEAAEARGELRAGGTVVEQSTGNTGPALAFVAGVKGYAMHLYMPSQLGSSYNPADRIRIARLFGCKVSAIDLREHLPQADTIDPVERSAAFVAIRMAQCYKVQAENPNVWWPNQLCNPDNTRAHQEGTGAEILKQMEGRVDAWVASMGTGGTLLGVAQALKAANPSLRVAGVLPTDDLRLDWVRSRAVHRWLEMFGAPPMRFLIEDILDRSLLDDEVIVENQEAKTMADRLCREEGLFCGMSSGANVVAANRISHQMPAGSRLVTVLVDRRDRYFAEYPDEHYVV